MSEGRQEEKSVKTGLSDVIQKLQSHDLRTKKRLNLQELLRITKNRVKTTCQSIEDFPEEIEEDVYAMADLEALIPREKMVKAKLAYFQRQNKEKAVKQAAFLKSQEKHYQSRVSHLQALQSECDRFQNILSQKRAKVGGYHQQVKTETGEIAKRNQVMKRLTATLDSNKPNILKEHKVLQSSSAELDKQLSDCQTEIRNLREAIVTKSKALETVKAENSSKTVEVTALRLKVEGVRAIAHSENQKIQEILSEFEAVEEKRKDTIAQLEAKKDDEQATYENAKKVHTDLIDYIRSEFGESKSLEEMILQAHVEIQKLDQKHLQFNERLNTICQSMQSNENKLFQLDQAKEDIWRQLDVVETLEENEDVHLRHKRAQGAHSKDTASSETIEPIFLLPLGLPKKAGNQSEALHVVRSPDSSITDFGLSTFELPVHGDQYEARNDYDRLETFRQHFFGKSDA